MANAWSLKQFTSPYSNHIFLIGTSDTHISNAEMFEGRRLNLIYGIGGNNTCGVADILKAFSHLRAALEGTDLAWHWLTSCKYTIFISAHISFFYANKTAVCEWRPSLVSYSSTWRGSKHTHCITIWCSFDRFEHGSTPGFDFAARMLVRVAFFFFFFYWKSCSNIPLLQSSLTSDGSHGARGYIQEARHCGVRWTSVHVC